MRIVYVVGVLSSCNSGTPTATDEPPETDDVQMDSGLLDTITEECTTYHSADEDYAPVQTVGDTIPNAGLMMSWAMPTEYVTYAQFSGTVGAGANHEGIDYIHGDQSVSDVAVFAASSGTVVYVRSGCPQSSMFGHNYDTRECGSGWGNHVIIDHGNEIFTRYAHLAPNTIDVLAGDSIQIGEPIASMGNTGRSELRHLHFELGSYSGEIDPCEASQSFDYVYDAADISELQP